MRLEDRFKIYIGPISSYQRNRQPIYKQERARPEMLSIGLTLTSLFISGQNGLQPRRKNMASLVLCVASFK
jgi:hypothetical protein